jgi:hypothetical protein
VDERGRLLGIEPDRPHELLQIEFGEHVHRRGSVQPELCDADVPVAAIQAGEEPAEVELARGVDPSGVVRLD